MSVYWVNYLCYKQTRRLTKCSVLAPTADHVSHYHLGNNMLSYTHSRGANSVNSIAAILQRGCISWNSLVVQLCLPILSFQNMILTPPKSHQQPKSLQTRNKEFYSGAIRLRKCKSQRTSLSILGLCGVQPLCSLLPPFPSERCNPWKIQIHLNASSFPIQSLISLLFGKPCPKQENLGFTWTMHCI